MSYCEWPDCFERVGSSTTYCPEHVTLSTICERCGYRSRLAGRMVCRACDRETLDPVTSMGISDWLSAHGVPEDAR